MLTPGGSGVFSGNTGQGGATNPGLSGVKAPLTLWEAHAKYTRGDLELRALYARGHLGDSDRIANATGNMICVIRPTSRSICSSMEPTRTYVTGIPGACTLRSIAR